MDDASKTRTTDPSLALKAWFESHASGSTGDAIHETIAEAILSRQLPPGWRLREEPLAALFSVSRTPVREALTRLESERLAVRDRRAGLVVSVLDREQILEIYVVREALDGIAARLAAAIRSPVDVAVLDRINSEMAEAAANGELERMARLNIDFHAGLSAASRNALLVQFVDQIHRAVRRFSRTTFSEPGRPQHALEEHAAIIDAIRRGDVAAAEEAARTHNQRALEIRMRMEIRPSEH